MIILRVKLSLNNSVVYVLREDSFEWFKSGSEEL